MSRRAKQTRGAQRPSRFFITSLGCPKNSVDSQAMAVLLQRAGYRSTDDVTRADLVVVNTCGFIGAARAESLETLRELAAGLREEQRLVAAGCWAQREPEGLLERVPRIDAVIGTRSWEHIVTLAAELRADPIASALALIEECPFPLPEEAGVPGYAVVGASAFLKVSDGCSRSCAFCAIPAIKGPGRSRSVDAILADTRLLQDMGVLEINLIAQDVTAYGHDLGMRDGLPSLLEAMVQLAPNIPWFRLLYAFPGFITQRLIDVMAEHPQILPYVDIPLQHGHPAVLQRMRRPTDVDWVRRTVEKLRRALPDVALRTTFIVGFPGETEEEFQALLDFAQEIHFDRVGVFTYSHEEGTAAAGMADDVPEAVKQARREALMLMQQDLSLERNRAFVGRRLPVLLEGAGDGLTVGRSYRDAPEIDGMVLIPGEIAAGQMIEVEITDALVYDLMARVVESPDAAESGAAGQGVPTASPSSL